MKNFFIYFCLIIRKGIQYLYSYQFYYHDSHFQLYDALKKIQNLIIQISKSSLTLYLYTLLILFKECRIYFNQYFNNINNIKNINNDFNSKEKVENEEKEGEEIILDNNDKDIINEDNNTGTENKEKNKQYNIDDIGFSFINGIYNKKLLQNIYKINIFF